ncbi:MAG: bifunctional lysine ketoglutarate reductase /saccharopine dehydrogenase family protein [Candidatus Cloacimonadota bacterium]|nr:bifunctional lysine ketoglutarate reductase /saccharopine dehydrogenase family protein [Candidatus Cloacimonadota bacterium]
MKIGIRREDKSKWERRVPLIPEHIKLLKEEYGIETVLQPSKIRVFSDNEYKNYGALIKEDLSECPVVFGIKEIPESFFQPNKTYVFFSHVIKGQSYNMPMLKRILALKCNLIDYERIVNENNKRLIFFGRHAGIAGMIDTLWAFGQRLKYENISDHFKEIKKAYQYKSLEQIKSDIKAIGEKIRKDGVPKILTPLVCGITGYGNVSKGAQEILDELPIIEISPSQLLNLNQVKSISRNHIHKVIFKEEHLVMPKEGNEEFRLQDYYENPQHYKSQFAKYIPHLSILVNCIYWTLQCPRFVTKENLKSLYLKDKNQKLQVIGDISCDINGSIEFTSKMTKPDSPTYVYNPLVDKEYDGIQGNGVVVMARGNLPCEIPRESSIFFSNELIDFVPQIVNAHSSDSLDKNALPLPIRKALIVYKGELTKDFEYIKEYL